MFRPTRPSAECLHVRSVSDSMRIRSNACCDCDGGIGRLKKYRKIFRILRTEIWMYSVRRTFSDDYESADRHAFHKLIIYASSLSSRGIGIGLRGFSPHGHRSLRQYSGLQTSLSDSDAYASPIRTAASCANDTPQIDGM